MKSYLRMVFLLVMVILLCVVTQAQIPSYIPTAGLVAYYPLNGNLTDATGGGSNGIAYGGVSYNVDRFGTVNSCFQGSGSSDVDIPVNNFPTGNSARSVSVFFKYKLPYAGGGRSFFCWGANSFGTRFGLYGADAILGIEYVSSAVTTPFTPDTLWHNLTVTYPSTGGGSAGIKIYVDGCLRTTSISGSALASFNTPSGSWHGLGGNIYYLPSYLDSWTGRLDDIGVWNRELTALEIQQIWTAGSVPPLLTGTNTICTSTSATLTTTTPGGTWTTSSGSVVTVVGGVITGLSTGTATITYTVLSGCNTLFDTQLVNVLPAPSTTIISGGNMVCNGSAISLAASVPGGSWSSSNSSIASVNSSGVVTGWSVGSAIISYTVTNACGTATDTQNVVVIGPPATGSITGPAFVCIGSTTSLSGGLPGGVWSSSNTAAATINTGGTVYGVAVGATIISYTVANFCASVTDTQLVNVIAVPSVGLVTGPPVICPGTAVTFSNSTPSGTWSTGSSAIVTINASTGIAGGAGLGTTIISYSITNACGTAVDTMAVTVAFTASAGTVSGPTAVCAGSTITLLDGVSGGTWISGNMGIATISSSGVLTGVSPGSVIISYSVTNACGTAVDTQMVSVTGPPVVPPLAGPSSVCAGSSISLTDAATGGVWSSSSTSVASVNAGNVYGQSAGVSTISYTLTNSCGPASALFNVTVNALPSAGVISGGSDVCDHNSDTLQSSVPGGSWSCSDLSVATITSAGVVYGISAGTAIITYTTIPDINGCIGTITFPLTILSSTALVVQPTLQPAKCNGGNDGEISVTVTGGTGSYTYSWSNSGVTPAITGLVSGSYSVIITDIASGCTVSENYVLNDPAQLEIQKAVVPDMCGYSKGSIEIVGIGGGTPPYSYLWSTGGNGVILQSLAFGEYSVTITDINLCAKTFFISVPEDSCNHIVIHDAMTPNGDGINDLWTIEGINAYPKSIVQVFDKWGDAVFAKEGYNNDWNGGQVPDGTYFYLIKLKGEGSSSSEVLKGSLLIKR